MLENVIIDIIYTFEINSVWFYITY